MFKKMVEQFSIGKTLDSNDQNQLLTSGFRQNNDLLGVLSLGLRKPGRGHCYLSFFFQLSVESS